MKYVEGIGNISMDGRVLGEQTAEEKMASYIEQLMNDVGRLKITVEILEKEALAKKQPQEHKAKEQVCRTVLLVGGFFDGTRVEQSAPTGRIAIPYPNAEGAIVYGVQKIEGSAGTYYIASPDNIYDSMAYMIARYPQFVSTDA